MANPALPPGTPDARAEDLKAPLTTEAPLESIKLAPESLSLSLDSRDALTLTPTPGGPLEELLLPGRVSDAAFALTAATPDLCASKGAALCGSTIDALLRESVETVLWLLESLDRCRAEPSVLPVRCFASNATPFKLSELVAGSLR